MNKQALIDAYNRRDDLAFERAMGSSTAFAPVRPRHVSQKHARGCGVAALSMLTSHDYEFVAAYFGGADPLEAKGLYLRGVDDYLADHGFAVARKCRYLGFFRECGGGTPERTPWPPEPFADVHLCEVDVHENAPTHHFVVMLGDGAVLDPLTEDPRQLSDYFRVLSVAGVYRIGATQ